ncbi:class I SAM-dependent methyltransferase [Marinicellulosiphila megalodicopiae]|uniref:class I SAM-dependent methyltransferase n=1 Tax=Marinicellulosiphila megalodicopiae TaxID=2724896 RepID=UPI003BB18435
MSKQILDPQQFAKLIQSRISMTDQAVRLFHGRGGCYEGLEFNIDYYPPYLHWRFYEQQDNVDELINALEFLGVEKKQHILQNRFEQGSPISMLEGELIDQWKTKELDVEYHLKLDKQNPGIFLDMQNGKQFVKDFAKDKKILNLFSYTCAFSLVACAGGAKEVINVDMSAGVLKEGQKNHQLNNFTQKVRYLKHNIMKSFGKLERLGPYDLVVIDPPSFQRGSFEALRHYAKTVRRASEFDCTDYLFCLNDPKVHVDEFKKWIASEQENLVFVKRIDNPQWLEEIDDNYSLKVLHYVKQ